MRLFIAPEDGLATQSMDEITEDQANEIDQGGLDVYEFRADGFYRAVVSLPDEGAEDEVFEISWDKVKVE